MDYLHMSVAGTGLIPWGTGAELKLLTKRPYWNNTHEGKGGVEIGRGAPSRGIPWGRTDPDP